MVIIPECRGRWYQHTEREPWRKTSFWLLDPPSVPNCRHHEALMRPTLPDIALPLAWNCVWREIKGHHSSREETNEIGQDWREISTYPSNGFLPVNSSRSNTPKEKVSLFVLPIAGWPWSGELYPVSLISISEACFRQSTNYNQWIYCPWHT